jgi:hypothetical protein
LKVKNKKYKLNWDFEKELRSDFIAGYCTLGMPFRLTFFFVLGFFVFDVASVATVLESPLKLL